MNPKAAGVAELSTDWLPLAVDIGRRLFEAGLLDSAPSEDQRSRLAQCQWLVDCVASFMGQQMDGFLSAKALALGDSEQIVRLFDILNSLADCVEEAPSTSENTARKVRGHQKLKPKAVCKDTMHWAPKTWRKRLTPSRGKSVISTARPYVPRTLGRPTETRENRMSQSQLQRRRSIEVATEKLQLATSLARAATRALDASKMTHQPHSPKLCERTVAHIDAASVKRDHLAMVRAKAAARNARHAVKCATVKVRVLSEEKNAKMAAELLKRRLRDENNVAAQQSLQAAAALAAQRHLSKLLSERAVNAPDTLVGARCVNVLRKIDQLCDRN